MNSLLAGKWPWMAASLAALTMLAVHRGCSGTTAAFDAGLLRLNSAGADSARRRLGPAQPWEQAPCVPRYSPVE